MSFITESWVAVSGPDPNAGSYFTLLIRGGVLHPWVWIAGFYVASPQGYCGESLMALAGLDETFADPAYLLSRGQINVHGPY